MWPMEEEGMKIPGKSKFLENNNGGKSCQKKD